MPVKGHILKKQMPVQQSVCLSETSPYALPSKQVLKSLCELGVAVWAYSNPASVPWYPLCSWVILYYSEQAGHWSLQGLFTKVGF